MQIGYRAASQLSRSVPATLIVGSTLEIAGSFWSLRAYLRRRVQVENEFDRLFEVSPAIPCTIGPDGVFRRINRAFERVLGHPPDALSGKRLLDLAHPACVAKTVEPLRGLPSCISGAFDNRLCTADCRCRWLSRSAAPVPDEQLNAAVSHEGTQGRVNAEALRAETSFRKGDGRFAGRRPGRHAWGGRSHCAHGCRPEITEPKLIGEINRRQQRLQQASRLITLSEMAASLSLDLNEPLSAIANHDTGCINRLQSGPYRVEEILATTRKSSTGPNAPARSSDAWASS